MQRKILKLSQEFSIYGCSNIFKTQYLYVEISQNVKKLVHYIVYIV